LQKNIENQDFWNSTEEAAKVLKEKERLLSMVGPVMSLQKSLDDILELTELFGKEGDAVAITELQTSIEDLAALSAKLQIDALLGNPNDDLNCFVEINAGAGGTEAQDWAYMLARMYTRWAEGKKYKTEIVDKNDGEEAGVKSITMGIAGHKAYGWLKKETGIHRLVRISPFDSNARRHTSFASVSVIPEVNDDIKIEINEKDLRIDTYRSSGAGGQHVNKTESAVRITHISTGLVTQCQTDRSQHKNKAAAMNMLKSKLYALKLQEKEQVAMKDAQAKTDIAWGYQIRSYVLQPYQMVKDARTGCENGNAYAVLDGEIDMFLESAISETFCAH
jgi:peptide chain release factor 2